MKLYVMDAFANRIFGGNQAGVALPDRELSDETMRQIAAEMKHSETAFIHMEPDGSVSLRYFTPAGEVDLCGHATVASFALLRQLEKIGDGDHIAHTKAGELNITVRGGTVWMDMAPPQLIGDIPEECATGTSNGALTYYLYLRGDVEPEQENVFLQGEHMSRPSEIRSLLYEKAGAVTVRIGGSAVMSLDCELKL